MTGAELRESLTRLGMRTVDAAKLFDVSRIAVEQWLNGRNHVPIKVTLILNTLEQLSPKDRLAWYTANIGVAINGKRGPKRGWNKKSGVEANG